MTDLAGALLRAALQFAAARLHEVETQTLDRVDHLVAALGGAGAATDLPGAQAEVDQANTAYAAFHLALTAPASLNSGHTAAAELGRALGHTDAAVRKIRPELDLLALLAKSFGAPIAPTGVAAQLGLQVPAGLTLVAGTLTYRVRGVGPVELGPMSVAAVDLSATLGLGDPVPTARIVVALGNATFGVSGAGFDGFVNAMLARGTTVSADVSIGVDSGRGLVIAGATRGPVALPARASSAALQLRGLTLDTPQDDPNAVDVGAQVAVGFGSLVRFDLDGIGVRLTVDPDQVQGGPAMLVGVKAPVGVGAAVDAGPVRGGGYLRADDGRYAGLLQLRLGPVEAHAFGIVDTRAPGGFSLVVSISAEFDPAIEIAIGFTLNGVGGIVGVQRVLDTGALLDRMHSHAIDQLLFPADPEAAAGQILQTLGAVFPARREGIVIGPMVKLGWGRPVSFVTAAVALVLQLPDPKIALLGTFRLAVPGPDVPIVDLKGQVFSEVTPEHVLVLVTLEDSRIAGYPVSGDVGIFLGLGSGPSFAISAGGFHPRFTPPPELAGMRRLSVDLSPPVLLTIRASAYVAFTTNSFQLGGRLEASGDAGPVGIHGFVQLDAILQWAPAFAFEVDLRAGFEMSIAGESFAGVDLRLHLAGPAPWTLHGTATLEIPILPDIDVEVGPITWGDARNPPPALVHPVALVTEALSRPEAWEAQLPAGAEALVTLRTDPAAGSRLVHPLGLFEGRQRAVPLELVISRIGPHPVPVGENRVHLGQPVLGQAESAGVALGAVSGVDDHFAPGQFLDLSDEEKLRAPAFEDLLAGVRLAPRDGVLIDRDRARQSNLHYNTVYPHQDLDAMREPLFSLISAAAAVVGAGAAGRSLLRRDIRYASVPDPLVFAAPGHALIRSVSDLSAPAGVVDEPLTYAHAAERLRSLPDPAGFQVVALGTVA